MEKIIEDYKHRYPNAEVEIKLQSDEGPYKRYSVQLSFVDNRYNPKFDNDNSPACTCGHSYERHFDPYENMAAIGCKYCRCHLYQEMPKEALMYERVLREAEYSYNPKQEVKELFESHIIQFEMLHYKHISFSNYFGKNMEEFEKIIENNF